MDVRTDPVRQRLAPARLREGEVRGPKGGDEDARTPLLPGGRIDDRNGVACPVDKQLLAGHMRLPHRRRHMLAPVRVKLAEPRVAVAVRMLGQMLLPEQRQRHPAPLQLALDRRPIDGGARICAGIGSREQTALQLGIVHSLPYRPGDPCQRCPTHIVGSLRLARPRCRADPAITQPQRVLEMKHLANLAHRQSLRWHRHPPLS